MNTFRFFLLICSQSEGFLLQRRQRQNQLLSCCSLRIFICVECHSRRAMYVTDREETAMRMARHSELHGAFSRSNGREPENRIR
jgi:hypothetical protein